MRDIDNRFITAIGLRWYHLVVWMIAAGIAFTVLYLLMHIAD